MSRSLQLPIFKPHERPGDRAPEELRSREAFEQAVSACVRCPLGDDRVQVVAGGGPDQARIMLVGGMPGRSEELAGRPFAGAAGNVIDKSLASVGLSRADVALTTVVKCRPPEDRAPRGLEIETCHPWLLEQVALHRPQVVLSLGELATSVLLRRRVPIGRIAGHVLKVWDDVVLVPTRDPQDAVKGNATAAAAIRRDLRTAVRLLDRAAGGAVEQQGA